MSIRTSFNPLGVRKRASGSPTAASYIQDGLIAQFDGIENAGIGVHDSAATVWVDLIGGNTLTLEQAADANSKGYWMDDCWLSPTHERGVKGPDFARYGGLSNDFVSAVNAARLTVEVVCRLNADLNNNPGFIHAYEGGFTQEAFLFWANQFSVRSTGWTTNRATLNVALVYLKGLTLASAIRADGFSEPVTFHDSAHPEIAVATPMTPSESGSSITTAGKLVIGSLSAGTHADSFQGAMYAVRIYNRPLSDAELATNYAIDKARFGI